MKGSRQMKDLDDVLKLFASPFEFLIFCLYYELCQDFRLGFSIQPYLAWDPGNSTSLEETWTKRLMTHYCWTHLKENPQEWD